MSPIKARAKQVPYRWIPVRVFAYPPKSPAKPMIPFKLYSKYPKPPFPVRWYS